MGQSHDSRTDDAGALSGGHAGATACGQTPCGDGAYAPLARGRRSLRSLDVLLYVRLCRRALSAPSPQGVQPMEDAEEEDTVEDEEEDDEARRLNAKSHPSL
eukprot:6192350-Pleurochrysis_carterae.AAC.3